MKTVQYLAHGSAQRLVMEKVQTEKCAAGTAGILKLDVVVDHQVVATRNESQLPGR